MNKERRKQINEAIDKIEAMKEAMSLLLANVDEARTLVEQVKDDEQEAFDNMPEGLQATERGTDMEAAISTLEDAYSELDDLHGSIEGVDLDDLISKLDEAKGMES